MLLEPFLLEPILVGKPWGGRRLAEFGKNLPPDELIGEAWEVADLDPEATPVDDPVTRVASGPCQGSTLAELIAADAGALLGGATPAPGGRFPLLIKLLDARESLSVQVHPPAEYVATHPQAALKTESWVVIDADPGAELLLGLVDGTTLDDLSAVIGTPDLLPLLRRVPAITGDVHHLPAGLIHALGAGVLVAEVQTPSDTTYRLYDWVEEYGRAPRALHLEAGRACLELAWSHNMDPTFTAPSGDGVLVDTPHYRLARHHLSAGEQLPSTAGTARVVLVMNGRLRFPQPVGDVGQGGVTVLPAKWGGHLRAAEDTTLLLISP